MKQNEDCIFRQSAKTATKLPKLPLWSGSFGRNYHNYQNYRKQMNGLSVYYYSEHNAFKKKQ